MSEGNKTEFIQKGPYNFVAVDKRVEDKPAVETKKVEDKGNIKFAGAIKKTISSDGTVNYSKAELK